MKSEHEEAERILNRALDFPSDEREVFLSGACGDDAALRDRVATLLRAHDEADQFLNDGITIEETVVSEGLGTVVDRYKLLQQIGEGGMGIVYMAEQTEPVKRKVALKIIKLGMDTKQVVARFEAERQALAMMDHPHIAKVLDAGATDTGRPYFVMELVRGVTITEYCRKNKLKSGDRLELFIAVSQAIQHSHQKGIIHRDIKPSNVLVTMNDGVPHPMVIDFGIAKATNHTLTEKTLFTNYAQMIGTPAYMSPEQAEMSKMDVDTRTDVYSLGVLLYELLTGTTPFPEKTLMSKGYGEMQRIIAEQEPEKPSTRLRGTIATAPQPSNSQRGELDRETIQALEGDLDWIIMKCLEKDRTRRYETVNGMVADLRRHLNNEPVTAAAPTFRYQLLKLYRRNRPVMRVVMGAAILLFVATVVSGTFAISAEREKRRALQETIKADEISNLLISIVYDVVPPLIARGQSEEALRIIQEVESKADHVLLNAPAAELQLRLQLMGFHRAFSLRLNDSVHHASRGLELLENLSDDQLKLPRDIVEGMFWGGVLVGSEPESESANNALMKLGELSVGTRPDRVDSRVYAYANMSSWFMMNRENDRALKLLETAWPMLPSVSDPMTRIYFLKRYSTLIRREGLWERADRVLDAVGDLDWTVNPEATRRYWILRKELVANKVAAGRSAEALSYLEEELLQAEEKGLSTLEILEIKAQRSVALFAAGRLAEATAVIEEVGRHPEAAFESWLVVSRAAAALDRTSLFSDLQWVGIRRFSGGVQNVDCLALVELLLANPDDKRAIEIGIEILREKGKINAIHFSYDFVPFLMALAELRMGNHMNAVRTLEVFEDTVGSVSKKVVSNLFWDSSVQLQLQSLKSLASVRVGDREMASRAYYRAIELMGENKDGFALTNPYSFSGCWRLFFDEATHAMRENGWLSKDPSLELKRSHGLD